MQSHSPLRQHVQQTQDGSLYPQLLPELQGLQSSNAYQQQQYALSGGPPHPHALHYATHGLPHSPAQQYPTFPVSTGYHHVSSPRFAIANTAPPVPLQHFQIPQGPQSLTSTSPTPLHNVPQQVLQRRIHVQLPQISSQQPLQQQQPHAQGLEEPPLGGHGQFQGLKLIANPADLETWRQRLFDVDDMITVTEEEFQTYFPHIDNVYSHRSTQRHKRKRFVSHYWDCRLKGRPPGTKKSTDPEKKKRKRVARERDLCDVKVKITEYFDQNEYEEQLGQKPPGAAEDNPSSPIVAPNHGQTQQYLAQTWGAPPTPSKKFYTFQRVNGNGGNGKGDGIAGPHKHSLADSDRVKKNSVIRWLAKCEKEDRKNLQGGDASKKTYHKKATGNALTTVKNHSREDDLKLYGSAFCPFVQRVWISLEHKHIPYQYIEVDPYKKPQSLLDVNPRGLVPALRHGPTWSTHESTVIMEYLEDLNTGPALLPPDAQTRATSRLWTDHINRNIIPWFYKLLQAQDQNDQVSHATELRNQISKLVDAADSNGPFFLGPQISFVDVQIAPWVVRLKRVLGPYRSWPEAEEGTRWSKWIQAIEEEQSVKMTTSTDELYLDSYERYAENRPGTSQLADAVNSGRRLP